MKKTVFTIICLLIFCFTVTGLDSGATESDRQGNLRLSAETMVPALPGFTSIGIGANYGLSNRFDIYAELSILPFPFTNSMLNFHSTGGARYYFSRKSNTLYIEAGGGIFGGGDTENFGVMPAATCNFGYEFGLSDFTLNVDLGIFYFLDSFISFPLPALTASFFF
ncbi:MAG: hypothetical protein JEY99_14835 [Spirochaetales bacterium]|nr:hypothetical protein [Spirochaetales bacterium]